VKRSLQLKQFIRANVPAGKIEAHAFRLVGEPREMIDRETRELFEALRRQSPSEAIGPRSFRYYGATATSGLAGAAHLIPKGVSE
jgi:hypothetical protein